LEPPALPVVFSYNKEAAAREPAAAWWGVEELNPYRRKMPN